MSKNLIIVESPAKAKTIKKYLGGDFEVIACYGHVRDLVPKNGAVDTANGFTMKYQVIDKNEKHVEAIARAMKTADALYLATDPDREGEAISWHLYELLKGKKLLRDKPVQRVVFHEITKPAVQAAIAHPRTLSEDLINAQQARRALDYLVGFNLSPLLWKKVRRGLSAGRVQSPALRMIVERQEEIERFVPREHWSIEADVIKDTQPFTAKLTLHEDKKITQFSVTTREDAHQIREKIAQQASGKLTVGAVEKKQRRRNPSAPFTTSTLQQEAAHKLGFTTSRTMRTAQQLYEGIAIGAEQIGLISYMRTDSVNLAEEAVAEIRQLIAQRYGKALLPKGPQRYKTRSKNAQEAHEAIRPTSALRQPEQIKDALSPEQFKLYELIWRRTVACQMIPAVLDTVAVDMGPGPKTSFRATGTTVLEPGFMTVYQETSDGTAEPDETRLPALKEGDRLELAALRTEQHFTEPPPYFTEASLVKGLEEYGIGRPSTYASIIATLQQREYVVLDKRRFKPTDVGRIVNKFLSQHFTTYVDYDFTAKLEDELDAVARGERQWVPLLESFWSPFKDRIDATTEGVARSDVTHEALDEACPQCSKPLSVRLGRRGRFVGCTGYPECNYTRNLDQTAEDKTAPETVPDRTCPQCGAGLIMRQGRYGKFVGCSTYPQCKFIESANKPINTGVTCPKCTAATVVERRSRYGKQFYSCAAYPKCDYATWNPPLAEPCPQCHWPILTIKITKRRGTEKVCPQKECGYSAPADIEEAEEPAAMAS